MRPICCGTGWFGEFVTNRSGNHLMCIRYLFVVSSLFTLLMTIRSVAARAETMRIGNKWLEVQLEPGDGTFKILEKSSARVFVSAGRFSGGGGQGKIAQAQIPNLGAAQSLQLTH